MMLKKCVENYYFWMADEGEVKDLPSSSLIIKISTDLKQEDVPRKFEWKNGCQKKIGSVAALSQIQPTSEETDGQQPS